MQSKDPDQGRAVGLFRRGTGEVAGGDVSNDDALAALRAYAFGNGETIDDTAARLASRELCPSCSPEQPSLRLETDDPGGTEQQKAPDGKRPG